jgi:hypothetical protein
MVRTMDVLYCLDCTPSRPCVLLNPLDCEGEMTYFCSAVQSGRLIYSAKSLFASMVPKQRV